jgi:hypothetical protein
VGRVRTLPPLRRQVPEFRLAEKPAAGAERLPVFLGFPPNPNHSRRRPGRGGSVSKPDVKFDSHARELAIQRFADAVRVADRKRIVRRPEDPRPIPGIARSRS